MYGKYDDRREDGTTDHYAIAVQATQTNRQTQANPAGCSADSQGDTQAMPRHKGKRSPMNNVGQKEKDAPEHHHARSHRE